MGDLGGVGCGLGLFRVRRSFVAPSPWRTPPAYPPIQGANMTGGRFATLQRCLKSGAAKVLFQPASAAFCDSTEGALQ